LAEKKTSFTENVNAVDRKLAGLGPPRNFREMLGNQLVGPVVGVDPGRD